MIHPHNTIIFTTPASSFAVAPRSTMTDTQTIRGDSAAGRWTGQLDPSTGELSRTAGRGISVSGVRGG